MKKYWKRFKSNLVGVTIFLSLFTLLMPLRVDIPMYWGFINCGIVIVVMLVLNYLDLKGII